MIPMSPRKQAMRRLQDELAPERKRWLERSAFFHDGDLCYLKFLVPEGATVLELGCGNGHLLAALKPSFEVGVDLSAGMIAQARAAYPNLTFVEGDVEDESLLRSLPGPFDAILVADTLGALDDCQQLFTSLHHLWTRQTRLVIAYVSHLWSPATKFAELPSCARRSLRRMCWLPPTFVRWRRSFFREAMRVLRPSGRIIMDVPEFEDKPCRLVLVCHLSAVRRLQTLEFDSPTLGSLRATA